MAKWIVRKSGADLHIHISVKELQEKGIIPVSDSDAMLEHEHYGNEIKEIMPGEVDMDSYTYEIWGKTRPLTKEERKLIGAKENEKEN